MRLSLMILFLSLLFSLHAEQLQVSASMYPVTLIVKDIGKDRVVVHTVVPPGVSPHSYVMKPSDARNLKNAAALFFIDNDFDQWISKGKLPVHLHRVSLMSSVPQTLLHRFPASSKYPQKTDPHFWLDPRIVQSILPGVAHELCSVDAEGCETYKANAEQLSIRLTETEKKMHAVLSGIKGKSFIAMHPSMLYMADRFGFQIADVLEKNPGFEPGMKELNELILRGSQKDIHAILSEPQFPKALAQKIARSSGKPLLIFDPIGNPKRVRSFPDLLLMNAESIANGN